ncbi:MAG: squalene synthase HpnC [Ignavibacteriales bacterium]
MGYEEAFKIAKRHYENFPVVSMLIPAHLRKHVAIVYWFARTADDSADEGEVAVSDRLDSLQNFETRLKSLIDGKCNDHFESALHNTIVTKKLSPEYLFKLLKAFKQDVIKNRYTNFDELLDYCSNSANPVGRIILELINVKDERAFQLSDKICTALQLTNFLQDTPIDFNKGRIYFPQDDMKKFDVTEKMFELKENRLNLNKLVEFSVNRIQTYFDEGKALLGFLSGKIRYEIDWTISGGEEILKKIRGSGFDVFLNRPVLSKYDYFKLLLKSIFRI